MVSFLKEGAVGPGSELTVAVSGPVGKIEV